MNWNDKKEVIFAYEGLIFKPIRQFTKEESRKVLGENLLKYIEWFDFDEYNYSKFYEKAKKIGAENFDIFEIQTGALKGIFAVPCINYLALITDKEIIGYDNFYRFKVAEKCVELYKKLYNCTGCFFSTKAQIYWNNENGYESRILVDFESKSLVFKIADTITDTKEFNDFYQLNEYLENKEEYSDKKITDKVASSILKGNVALNDLSETKQYTYIYFLYKYILYNLYSDRDIVNYKMIDFFDDEFVDVEDKTIENILKKIRDDVLEQIKKDINIWLFDDMYYGE